jgi:peptidoglycan/xylan/chitin deacetylase (PgdA/CDA1 family)
LSAALRRRSRGRRRAGQDWTFTASGDKPVTGSHRHPSTLPIESWLLIGRHRQQALLAALVAVGLFMVMIPTQQKPVDVEAVSAAQRQAAAAAVAAANGGSKIPPGTSGRATKPAQREDPADADTPSRKAPGQTDPGPTTPGQATPGQSTPGQTAPGLPAPSQPAGSGEVVPPVDETPAPGAETVTAGRRGSGPGNSVRRTTGATVALTFDDGPDAVQTPKLLNLLAKHDVKATFCLVGVQVRAHPDLVRRIVAEGHALCNHSWNHSFTLGKKTAADIRADLDATDRAIRAAVPDAKIPYFRAPGGNFTKRLVTVADEFGMTSLYWEVDPRDWEQPDDESDNAHVERIITQVEDTVRDGSIVLSHDFKQPGTIEAYETLLPKLTKQFTLGLP